MSEFRFILEPYTNPASRYSCPSCGKKKTFTRYLDTLTNEYLSSRVGKCDRLQKCGYHYPPKQFFEDQELFNKSSVAPVPLRPRVKPDLSKKKGPVSYIEEAVFQESLQAEGSNNFLSFLSTLVTPEVLDQVKQTYRLGTSKYWKGSTVFWQIDEKGRIRTGKVIQYDRLSGRKKRVNWMHSLMQLTDYNLEQCLFGLHLLPKNTSHTIAIVESEKTAVIASIAYPQYTWMATGGLQNLRGSLLKPLRERHVILFPDAGCSDYWREKMEQLPQEITYDISEMVERTATPEEKEEGFDLADYIIPVWQKRRKSR